MGNLPYTKSDEVLRDVFDPVTGTLNTTISNADVNINVSAFTDSIKIGDGLGDTVSITDVAGKKSLDVNVTDIVLSYQSDSVTSYAPNLTSIVDEASDTVIYVGAAVIGSAESASVWQIKKITTTGTILKTTYADGNANYDNIWNNRASLSYS